MLLVPVPQTTQRLHFPCARCGREVDEAFADLEGPSFRAYFCAVCTAVLESGMDPGFAYQPEVFT
ncbi:MAG: hypothetical protein ACREIS_05660 [Nitrospiraceae bacterium]